MLHFYFTDFKAEKTKFSLESGAEIIELFLSLYVINFRHSL